MTPRQGGFRQIELTQPKEGLFAKSQRIGGKSEVLGSEMSTPHGTLWREVRTKGRRNLGSSIGAD